MSIRTLWHNGRLTQEGPVFTAQDRIRFGDGVFDTMLAADGRAVYAEDHFERLIRHARAIHIRPDFTFNQFAAAAHALLEQNGFSGRAVLRTIITRGAAECGLRPPETPAIEIVMTAQTAPAAYPPCHAILSETIRRNAHSPLSRIKSLNYGEAVLGLIEAGQKNANEVIFLNHAGRIACASAGNVFVMLEGRLFTPPLTEGVVDGITRRKLIDDGAAERILTLSDLASSQGIYITSAIRGVFPVTSFNGKIIQKGKHD